MRRSNRRLSLTSDSLLLRLRRTLRSIAGQAAASVAERQMRSRPYSRRNAYAIRPFLAGKAVDPEIISEMSDALQSVCKALSYLKPASNDFLERWPISKRVDIPALLIERVELAAAQAGGRFTPSCSHP